MNIAITALGNLYSDVLLTSVARGDVLYRGASKWNNLAAGASGSLLMSGGAGADPSWSASLPASIITSGTIGAARLGSGTADTTTFLRGDQTWQTVTVPTAANPSASVGLSAVNGSAATFMRSDAAPALSQAITPTWTGQHVFETGAAGASPTIFRQTGGTLGTHELQIGHNGTNPIIESKSGGIRLIPPSASNYVSVQAGNNTGTQYSVRLWHDAGASSYLDSQNGHMTMRQPVGSYTRFGNTNGYIGLNVISPDGRHGGTIFSAPYTPSQITSNQNNYNPGASMFVRASSDASRDITGISVSQQDGQVMEIWNVGAQNIVLKHQDTNSTAANRFICTASADITLAADEVALLRYDSTTARWRVRKI